MKQLITKMSVMLFLAAAMLTTTSCNTIDSPQLYGSYATVKGSSLNFTLKTDDGHTLLIAKNEVPGFMVKNDMRVIAYYEYVKEAEPKPKATEGKQVVLKMLYEILTKEPLLESAMSSIGRDTLGYDPVYVRDIWCCEGYINADFELKGSSRQHSVNLLIEDSKSTSNEIFAVFCHNANGDQPEKSSLGTVSFHGRQLMSPGSDSVRVHVSFTDYYGNKSTKSATLRRTDLPGRERSVQSVAPSNYILPLK